MFITFGGAGYTYNSKCVYTTRTATTRLKDKAIGVNELFYLASLFGKKGTKKHGREASHTNKPLSIIQLEKNAADGNGNGGCGGSENRRGTKSYWGIFGVPPDSFIFQTIVP